MLYKTSIQYYKTTFKQHAVTVSMLENTENDTFFCTIYAEANLQHHYLLLQLLPDKFEKSESSHLSEDRYPVNSKSSNNIRYIAALVHIRNYIQSTNT